jgi:hypothetical protein
MRISRCFVCNNLIFSLRKQIGNSDFAINEKDEIFDSYKCYHCAQTVIITKDIRTLKIRKIWLELENEKIRLKNLAESYKLKANEKKNSQKVINYNTSKFFNIKGKLNELEHCMKASIRIKLQSSKSEKWVRSYNLQKILRK